MLFHNFFFYLSHSVLSLVSTCSQFSIIPPLMLGSMDNLKTLYTNEIYKNTHILSNTEAPFGVPPAPREEAPGAVVRRWSVTRNPFPGVPSLTEGGLEKGWLQRDLARIGGSQAWDGMCDEAKVSRSERYYAQFK